MKLKGTTFGETLDPAMGITDQTEADDYFDQLVEHYMTCEAAIEKGGRTRQEAEEIVRSNLGYYADYYSTQTQDRVNRLFRITHPVFGDKQPTTEEAYKAGKELGQKNRR